MAVELRQKVSSVLPLGKDMHQIGQGIPNKELLPYLLEGRDLQKTEI